MPVGGVCHAQGWQEGGMQGLEGSVFVSQEQCSHILLKGACTVCGPEVWLVGFGGVVEEVQVVQLGDREVAQASAPGIIAESLLCVCSGEGGGTGGANLEEVLARGWDVIMGVVIISVDKDMGIDQMVDLSIEGPCHVVLPLLSVGCKVGILSGVGQERVGLGSSGLEGVDHLLKGGVSVS